MAIALLAFLEAVKMSPKVVERFIVHYCYEFIINEHINLVNNGKIY
jgi:hypothetical protein